MAALTRSQITIAGLAPSLVAAGAAGDTVPAGKTTFVRVVNAHASASRTVTLTTPATHEGLAVADPAIVVPGPGEMMIGPLPRDLYGDADGLVALSYSDSGADLTVAAFYV